MERKKANKLNIIVKSNFFIDCKRSHSFLWYYIGIGSNNLRKAEMSLQFEEEDANRSSSVNDIRIEITDDEIKKLSQYFQNSRDEIQKVFFFFHSFWKDISLFKLVFLFEQKVDSLLAIEIPAPKKIIKSPSSEKDLNSKSKSQQGALIGKPIDLETATVFRLEYIIVNTAIFSTGNFIASLRCWENIQLAVVFTRLAINGDEQGSHSERKIAN